MYIDQMKLKFQPTLYYNTPGFPTMDIFQIYKYFCETKLCDVFVEITKLCELMIGIPVTSAAIEKSSSALKRIKTYLRTTLLQQRLSNLALLSIEKKLLIKFLKIPTFTMRGLIFLFKI